MKILAFQNPDGSMGKSTTVTALAHLLAKQGRRVLVCDLDIQGNGTTWIGGRRDTAGISQCLRVVVANDPAQWPGIPLEQLRGQIRQQALTAVQHTACGADLIGSDVAMEATVQGWANLRPQNREQLLAELLAALSDDYDVALLDCKGAAGPINTAAQVAATANIGVSDCTSKGVGGLGKLSQQLAPLDRRVDAVIPVKVWPRNRGALADDIYRQMCEQWPVTPPARGTAALDNAQLLGEPVTMWDPDLPLSHDYEAVLANLDERGLL